MNDAEIVSISMKRRKLDHQRFLDRFLGDCVVFKRVDDTHHVVAYYEDGLLHKDDGPAIIRYNPEKNQITQKKYYSKGMLHREGDKPAIKVTTKDVWEREWYVDDELHRVGAPCAILFERLFKHEGMRELYKDWRLYGKLHRLDGPTLCQSDGHPVQWHLMGEEIARTEFETRAIVVKILPLFRIFDQI